MNKLETNEKKKIESLNKETEDTQEISMKF